MEQDLLPGLPHDVAAECLLRVNFDALFLLPLVCRRWRDEIRSPSFFHRRRIAHICQPIFALLLRSTDDIRIFLSIILFNQTTGRWHRLPHVPDNSGSFVEYNLVEVGHRIVVVGVNSSWENVPNIYIYDLFAGTGWRSGAPCPVHQKLVATLASDGLRTVFVAGGRDHCSDFLPTAMSYDVEEDRWHMLPNMPHDCAYSTGVFHAGIFYVVGGVADTWSRIVLNSAEQYNITTGHRSTIYDYLPFIDNRPRNLPTKELVFGSDGKCYRCDIKRLKLWVKHDQRWEFVCDLPSEIQVQDWQLIRWKGGFAVCEEWKWKQEPIDVIYVLTLDGTNNNSLSCRVVNIPNNNPETKIYSGCYLRV